MKKGFFWLFILLLHTDVFGQWHQLVKMTYQENGPSGIQTKTLSPGVATPVKNGKIYFGTFGATGNHTSQVDLYYSNDDYQAYLKVFAPYLDYSPGNTGASMSSINSFNDTTVSIKYLYSGIVPAVIFTFNNFRTYTSLGSNYYKGSHCMTKKYLYVMTRAVISAPYTNVPASNDNLVLERMDSNYNSLVSAILPNYLNEGGKEKNLFFTNDSIGYFLCRHRNNPTKTVLLKTLNFGQNWVEIINDSIDPIVSFSFPSANTGYLLKTSGVVLKTTNAGSTWLPSPAATTATFNCIKFADNNLGYIGGKSGVLYKTTDGGASWQPENSTTTGTIDHIYAFANDVAYFVLSDATVYKNKPDYVGLKELREDLANWQIYPNPADHFLTLDLSALQVPVQEIEFVNLLGEKVYRVEKPGASLLMNIPVGNFAAGSYIITIKTENAVSRKKVVLNH